MIALIITILLVQEKFSCNSNNKTRHIGSQKKKSMKNRIVVGQIKFFKAHF